ncbi:TrkH family potassium uptake protein [Micromonospora peucetia]|uniref:Potassium uptake protein, TrkH family n=1 Tax=Micromonospora peucetia TaxID=47871 RepID=A0A1C6V7Q4_9ACTN|nr:potassium transporter TrkG [Micromonospora peucetia]MCX4389335.1 TrkH family potassium uptake protein [Micromonospora peucetia]WSA29834.1 TrkH family potassium uptake protein [Micromonospora peucetia]SCL62306.1 potassium uptake protein, TrkH family [Micromonospora peucetia]
MRRLLRHPVRLVPLGFLVTILVGTGLLMLPWATSESRHTPFLIALFTSTSAVSVTGMAVVDTPNYWNEFGLVMITVLTQVGGLGIVTGATLVVLVVARRLGLRSRLLVQAETAEFGIGDVRRLLLRIAGLSLVCEVVITAILTTRLWIAYDYPFDRALWSSVFHAVQAFNNGGFALYTDNLIAFSTDAWVTLPLAIGTIVGGLGFPALFEAVREWRQPNRWAIATKLTIWGSLTLLVVGFLGLLVIEWANVRTLGIYAWPDKLLVAFAQNSFIRTGGFNVVDVTRLEEESYPLVIALMFIGGGSASTAGGIKVTTFFLLAFVMWAELRGEPDVTVGQRRVATASQRQAITVALLSVALVVCGTVVLIFLTEGVRYYEALFEVTSAFTTTGLSVGVAAALPESGQLALIVLMFVGRIGPLTLGSAIALNTRRRLYRYAEEQPIVG